MNAVDDCVVARCFSLANAVLLAAQVNKRLRVVIPQLTTRLGLRVTALYPPNVADRKSLARAVQALLSRFAHAELDLCIHRTMAFLGRSREYNALVTGVLEFFFRRAVLRIRRLRFAATLVSGDAAASLVAGITASAATIESVDLQLFAEPAIVLTAVRCLRPRDLPKLQDFRLWGSIIDHESDKQLCIALLANAGRLLEHSPRLHMLYLEECGLTNADITVLAQMLGKFPRGSGICLNLTGNNLVTDTTPLLDVIEHLQLLNPYCGRSEDALASLADALPRARNLTTIWIQTTNMLQRSSGATGRVLRACEDAHVAVVFLV